MKRRTIWAAALLCVLALAGCGGQGGAAPDGGVTGAAGIPFQEGQLYAVAYLGYQELDDLAYYTETYLDGGDLPVHYLSKGDYYLVIPRYEDMALRLSRRDVETGESQPVYEDPACRPFILQCNVSDIFADAVVSLTRREESAEFSPYISLMDGSVQVGERGLDITQ